MINYIYQLVEPRLFAVKFKNEITEGKIIIRPTYMSICHADQRYYRGERSREVLSKKLPMALIHEFCGSVVSDITGQFCKGEQVTVIPNTPCSDNQWIQENYRKDSIFCSSGYDGFMQEFVIANPDRVVSCNDIDNEIAAITEFVSIAVHAIRRFERISYTKKERIAVFGDGSLSFVVSNLLKERYPDTKLIIIGKHRSKLQYFTFADEVYYSDSIPPMLQFDHAFECCGGIGAEDAIRSIITGIEPEGCVMLMGVSENEVPINTRMSLERGLSYICCSRSGKEDFQEAVMLLKKGKIRSRIKQIIQVVDTVSSIDDIHRVFLEDSSKPFKTVFKWEL